MPSTPPKQDRMYIFGGDSGRPWNPSNWTGIDDRVRGGKSISHLQVADPKTHALFNGHLDITALGGAGFASQRTVPSLFRPALNLSAYDTLVIDVVKSASDTKTYTLILKDTEPLQQRPDGREQSTVSWEYDFNLGRSSGGRVAMRLEDFKPTYRGRPKPDAEPLDQKRILALSIMMRSHFGEQEGDFALAIRSIAAEGHDSKLQSGPTPIEETKENEGVAGKEPNATASKGGWLPLLTGVFRGQK